MGRWAGTDWPVTTFGAGIKHCPSSRGTNQAREPARIQSYSQIGPLTKAAGSADAVHNAPVQPVAGVKVSLQVAGVSRSGFSGLSCDGTPDPAILHDSPSSQTLFLDLPRTIALRT